MLSVKTILLFEYLEDMRTRLRLIATFAICFSALTLVNASASEPKVTKVLGNYGESISATASQVKFDKKGGAKILLQGQGFDETVGIYLAFCVFPPKGQTPTPCGGGINKSGVGTASFWISSNAPPYAVGLAEPFLPGGRFAKKISVSSNIGEFDCRKVRCALTVRADHLRAEDRSRDLFIPVTFSK